MYADDVRIAVQIKSHLDVERLQSTINRLDDWCVVNDLHLNKDKCSVLPICRGRNPIAADYFLGTHALKRVSEQRDLGILIDHKLNFIKHTEAVTSKALATLGFVKRFCFEIKDPATLKAVYCSLVQSILEYCSIVWMPSCATHINKIESIARQFTMFALGEFPNAGNNFHISSYSQRLESLGMKSLQTRRIEAANVFLFDLIKNYIHCPFVLNLVEQNRNPRSLRRTEHFKISDPRMSRTPSAPITQICRYANNIKDLFLKCPNRISFKRAIGFVTAVTVVRRYSIHALFYIVS
jgi:hypothetical protein